MPNPSPAEAARIECRLSVAHGSFALDVGLDLPGRGITAIFGASGSGKTTLLRLMAGLERGRGSVRVLGEDWQDDARGLFLPPHRRRVGYVFQEPSLFPHLDVRGNLQYGYQRRRADGLDFDATVGMLELGALLERAPARLSGGERQRVALARALLSAPRILLLDEPLAALDAARKSDVLPYLERLRDELSLPILYVTHSSDEVVRLADHLVVLSSGRVAASDATVALFGRVDLPFLPPDELGALLECTVSAHDDRDRLSQLEFDGGVLWVARVERAQGARARVRVLARDVSLSLDAPGPSSILNHFRATVLDVQDDGPARVLVQLVLDHGQTRLLARITRRSREALGLRPGLTVHAQVKSVAVNASSARQ